jgi:L-rhamnose mutarotase
MNRYVLTTDLVDDPAAMTAYRRHHDEIWPEVVRSLTAAGVRELDIYQLGTRLVMVLELENGLDPAAVFARHSTSHPRVAEWEGLMKMFQRAAAGSVPGEWWGRMERVFELSAHKTAAAAPVDLL